MTIAKSSSLPPWMWMSRARQRLSQYLASGTSEISLGQVHHTKPNHVYFDASRDAVARSCPYPMMPSMALPPGHAFSAKHPDGTPLLVYRDAKDYTARAYINSCRHRGAQLLHSPTVGTFETTPLKSPTLTCPYHAWTYDARTGDLKGIPGHEKAFCKMDKGPFGLQSVTCQEQAGMVWVGGDQMRQDGLWSVDEMDVELKPFLFSPLEWDTTKNPPPHASRIVGYREWEEVPVNWQLLVETALESYHVKSLHQKTFHKIVDPTWAMVSDWTDKDRNFRMTIPLRNLSQDGGSSSSSNENQWTDRDIQKFMGQTSTTYMLFPMTTVVFTKRFFAVVTLEPLLTTTAKTSTDNPPPLSKIRAWGLSHRFYDPSTEQDGEKLQERDFNGLITAAEEDWNCTMKIQEGLNANATREFIYGGYEGNNVQYLKNVTNVAEQLRRKEEGNNAA